MAAPRDLSGSSATLQRVIVSVRYSLVEVIRNVLSSARVDLLTTYFTNLSQWWHQSSELVVYVFRSPNGIAGLSLLVERWAHCHWTLCMRFIRLKIAVIDAAAGLIRPPRGRRPVNPSDVSKLLDLHVSTSSNTRFNPPIRCRQQASKQHSR